MTFTSIERKQIYEKAIQAELASPKERASLNGVCKALYQINQVRALWGIPFGWIYFERKCTSLFPELGLFKELKSNNDYWLDGTDRVLVLGFCIAMTK